MSRTMLTVLTAIGLIVLSLIVMIGRYHVLGDEILVPRGPNTWHVTMKVNGTSLSPHAKMQTLTPLDFAHQHIKRESCQSEQLLNKPPSARHPERRVVLWSQRPGVAPGHFQDQTGLFGITEARWRGTGFGTTLADLDHDGRLDLVIVNGRISARDPGPTFRWAIKR